MRANGFIPEVEILDKVKGKGDQPSMMPKPGVAESLRE